MGDGAHPQRGVVAVAAAGNLIDAAYASAQFPGIPAELVVLLQERLAGGREVTRQGVQVARVVVVAVAGPALQLLPDIEGEGVHALGWHLPPWPRTARAQIRRHMDRQIARRVPPADSHQQCQQHAQADAGAEGADMRLQVHDLILEPAHGVWLRRVVQ
ncbi:hypothetical protein D9M69_558100 [compost metagenome]